MQGVDGRLGTSEAADGVEGYVETPFRPRISECVPMEILSIDLSTKRKRRDGQVDRQVFTALGTSKGCLDGHVIGVHHERKANTNQYLADVTQGRLKAKKEVRKFWIREHKRLETGGTLHRCATMKKLFQFSGNNND